MSYMYVVSPVLYLRLLLGKLFDCRSAISIYISSKCDLVLLGVLVQLVRHWSACSFVLRPPFRAMGSGFKTRALQTVILSLKLSKKLCFIVVEREDPSTNRPKKTAFADELSTNRNYSAPGPDIMLLSASGTSCRCRLVGLVPVS